jgi:hypothetical protein
MTIRPTAMPIISSTRLSPVLSFACIIVFYQFESESLITEIPPALVTLTPIFM